MIGTVQHRYARSKVSPPARERRGALVIPPLEWNDMPKPRWNNFRSGTPRRTVVRGPNDATMPPTTFRPCRGSDHCARPLVPGAPVELCGKHLRRVYEFAQDMIAERWDGAVKEYIAEQLGEFKPPAAVKRGIRSEYVYFIRFGDRVKVGYTTDPESRLRGLPHEEVIGVIPGTKADEHAWHELLADHHIVGEWFAATPEVLAALSRVAGQVG